MTVRRTSRRTITKMARRGQLDEMAQCASLIATYVLLS
jgi:hypothetical protein